MVRTRKKDYGEQPPPQNRMLFKATEDDNPNGPRITDRISCTDFTLFPKLPPELRLGVWQMSMTTRLVVVQPGASIHYMTGQEFRQNILPAQFSVNREARECAYRHYDLKFTIAVIADTRIFYSANVVMSSDDTLGLLGWDRLPRGVNCKFQVERADASSPWASNIGDASDSRRRPEVKKVAYLDACLIYSPNVIHVLNSTASWDLTSILHTEYTKLRKLFIPGPPWYKFPCSLDRYPINKQDHVVIQSRKFRGTLQEWGERLLYRARHDGLPRSVGAPDILAFELGKEFEGGFTRYDGIAYAEDNCFPGEFKWIMKDPERWCPQGF